MKLFALFLYSLSVIALLAQGVDAAPVTPNSFHFLAVPNGSITCAATTGGVTAAFGAGAAAKAPDVIVRNIGTVPVNFEIYAASAPVTASATTSQVINPGEADLLSKYASDTVGCITASGSASIVATPGTGN